MGDVCLVGCTWTHKVIVIASIFRLSMEEWESWYLLRKKGGEVAREPTPFFGARGGWLCRRRVLPSLSPRIKDNDNAA